VLDADPLSDPAILADPGHVRMVVLGGDVVKDLDAPTPALPQRVRKNAIPSKP
jgi:hypothetical protein